ncbi:MAG: biotin synthase BioB [Thermincolia bacterium]
MHGYISSLGGKVLNGETITRAEALELTQLKGADILLLGAMAAKIREGFAGNRVDLCSIINARSGSCSEDCKFCAQSAHHSTGAPVYKLIDEEEIIERAKAMEKAGAHHFDIVTTGMGIKENDSDFEKILKAFARIKKETNLNLCACLGTLTPGAARKLVEVGVKRYNHNLETAESYFAQVVSSHSYGERVETVRIAKEAGLEVCCGGIIGMGETPAQRVELAFALKELDVDAVPVNVLNPVAGTPMEDCLVPEPMEVLKTFAIFRFILPDKNIRYAGGRERAMGDLQALGLMAGINGMLVGNYLTTAGRDIGEDLKMIRDLGLEV